MNTTKQEIQSAPFEALDGMTPSELFGNLPTPFYLIDEKMIRRNGRVIHELSRRAGCSVLLAQKAFSNFGVYPALSEYLTGTEASGLFEARLGREEMPRGEVHVFSAAYRDDEFDSIAEYADHIVFNSPRQFKKFAQRAKDAGCSVGLRINPELSTQKEHEIYDPCAPGSRLGTARDVWDREMSDEDISQLDGIHFHTLCEQDSCDLWATLRAVEEKFGDILSLASVKWLNMGGGHHITRRGYDMQTLERCIRYAKEKWNVKIYLEPGEAWALNAGFLGTRILDITENGGIKTAVADASAACHMPDVIEMPYTPPLWGERRNERGGIRYRVAGPTCLAGDIVGDYSFDRELREGDLLLFGDMAIYTTCKNNTFNGMPLPAIYFHREDGSIETLASFSYEDFKCRLGRK